MSDEPEPALPLVFRIDRDEVVGLVQKLWDTNQELHAETRRLDGELSTTRVELDRLRRRFEHIALGVGQIGLLVSVAKAVVGVRDKGKEATVEDWAEAFKFVGLWEYNNRDTP